MFLQKSMNAATTLHTCVLPTLFVATHLVLMSASVLMDSLVMVLTVLVSFACALNLFLRALLVVPTKLI